MFKFPNKNKAFTVVESLVTILIITVLSLIILPNYTSLRQELAFQRSANKLAQDIRKVQEMAMSAQEFGGAIPEGGYGIYLRTVPPVFPHTSYALYIDENNNRRCDGCVPGTEEFIGRVDLESGIKILSLDENHVNIIFKPPDPTVFFTDEDGVDLGLDQVSIVFSLISDETKTITINVNKVGLINIE